MVELLLIFRFVLVIFFVLFFQHSYHSLSLNLECCTRMSIKDSFLEFSGLSRFHLLLLVRAFFFWELAFFFWELAKIECPKIEYPIIQCIFFCGGKLMQDCIINLIVNLVEMHNTPATSLDVNENSSIRFFVKSNLHHRKV